MRKIFVSGLALFIAIVTAHNLPIAHAADSPAATSSPQAQVDASNQQITDLNQQIAIYQTQLQKVGADKKTLQAAIGALDLQRKKIQAQVTLTELQINATNSEIKQRGSEITGAKQTITTDQAVLGGYLRNLQKRDGGSLIVEMLSSGSFIKIWDDFNATLKMQHAVQGQMQTLRIQENDLANLLTASKHKQQTLSSQQQALASQQQSLAAAKQSKNQLLAETKSQESSYQKLLAIAQAELKSFSTFTQNAGGSKLLANQTSCDAWGCYYNQRDTAWGSTPLNGTKYTLASAGCLVAVMAMILTHYGYPAVTPATINADADNFAGYSRDLLLMTINAGGTTATRKSTGVSGATSARKIAAIDAILSSGNPAVVGLNAYGGTHFIAITSGSNGNYLMRDPYVPNGNDISFTSHYTIKEIYTVAKVVING